MKHFKKTVHQHDFSNAINLSHKKFKSEHYGSVPSEAGFVKWLEDEKIYRII